MYSCTSNARNYYTPARGAGRRCVIPKTFKKKSTTNPQKKLKKKYYTPARGAGLPHWRALYYVLVADVVACIRQHTSACVRIRQHTASHTGGLFTTYFCSGCRCLHTSAYVSIRQHTSEYVSIRQHTASHTGGLFTIFFCSRCRCLHEYRFS